MKAIARQFILVLLCMIATGAWAQDITNIHGVVSDDMGGLAGASVCEIDGTGRIIEATVTDINGNFSMKVRNHDDRPWMFFDGLSVIIIYVDGVEHVCRGLNTYGVGESQIMFFDFNIYDEDEGDIPQESYTIHAAQVLGFSYTRDFWSMEVQPGGEYNGLESVTTDRPVDDAWYNLQGIRIPAPTVPGIYIHNGNKIFIR